MERKKTYNFEKFCLHVLLFLLFNDTVVGQTQSKWERHKKKFRLQFLRLPGMWNWTKI